MNKDQLEYFKKTIKGNFTKDIIKLYYDKFGILLTKEKVKAIKRKYHLTSGIDTTFKKGDKPHNYKPVGYEFTRDDGYIYIKIAEPNIWEFKHHYIYKKYKGDIPKGYSVVFLDQDKTNFDINNLYLVKIKDKLVAKNNKLFTSDKELTKTGLLVAELINKNYEIRKDSKND